LEWLRIPGSDWHPHRSASRDADGEQRAAAYGSKVLDRRPQAENDPRATKSLIAAADRSTSGTDGIANDSDVRTARGVREATVADRIADVTDIRR
jgi:hypothetical protein